MSPSAFHRVALLLAVWLLFATAAAAQSPPRSLDWVYLENEQLRVGLLRSHGGAIGYLSARDSDRNLLNHYDHGRLVQQSYYGDEDGSRWADQDWRYNPVQAGDYQGHAAELLEFKATATSAYARTRPRNWAGGQLLEDCEMEQWVELDGPLVRLKFAFWYRGEKTHAPRDQETPAMFVAPELRKLVSYTGTAPWTDAPLANRQPGWPNESVKLAEHWVAWVDDRDTGIGLYVPQADTATCYRYKGGSGSDCSYVAPLQQFALKPDLRFSYSAWLTIGEVGQIRSRFKNLHSSLPPASKGSPDEP
jgi:hypothetical protein